MCHLKKLHKPNQFCVYFILIIKISVFFLFTFWGNQSNIFIFTFGCDTCTLQFKISIFLFLKLSCLQNLCAQGSMKGSIPGATPIIPRCVVYCATEICLPVTAGPIWLVAGTEGPSFILTRQNGATNTLVTYSTVQ